MFYTTLEVSVPVHQVRCDVTYHNPRHATAFERMLLGLVDRVPVDSPMRQLSVVEVFGQHLCVPLAAGLLAPSLDDLVDLEVLALATPGRPTPTLTLGALQLTAPRGRSVLELGQVPGRPTVAQTAHTFDPIAQFTRGPMVLAVTNSLPATSVKEFIDYVKKNPDKLERKKFCRTCKKHTLHKEIK